MKRHTVLQWLATPLFFMSTASLVLAGETYPKDDSHKILEKVYEGSYRVERAYEIGKGNVSVSIDCAKTEAQAKEALAELTASLVGTIKSRFEDLDLAGNSELHGYELAKDEQISIANETPIVYEFIKEQNQYRWRDRCTNETFDKPVRHAAVIKVTQNLAVWLPNKDKTLVQLGELLDELEKQTSQSIKGSVTIVPSGGNQRFALDVTKGTRTAAEREVSAKAKERAAAKKASDLAAKNYNDLWFVTESFVNGQTNLIEPSVEQQEGKWQAVFRDTVTYDVYMEQLSTTAAGGIVSSVKTYAIPVEVFTSESLFGELRITVAQDCKATADEARSALKPRFDALLAELQQINGGANTETDRLQVDEPVTGKVSPYTAYEGGDEAQPVIRYYNRCTLELTDAPREPTDRVFRASQSITIRSWELDRLQALAKKIAGEKLGAIDDPNEVQVSADSFRGHTTFAVRDAVSADIAQQADQKFLCKDSQYFKDVQTNRIIYACLTNQPDVRPRYPEIEMRARSAADLGDSAPGGGGPSAEERGVQVFEGTYRMTYVVRKELPTTN